MRFPFWFTGEEAFYKPDKASVELVIQHWIQKCNGCQNKAGEYIFDGKQGLAKLPSLIKLKVDTQGATIGIKYFISLFESNILLIAGISFSVVLFYYGNSSFAITALVVGVFLYLTNALIVGRYLKSLLSQLGDIATDINMQQLWEQQQQWLINPKVCPACGETINEYADSCVNCGLHLQTNMHKPQPTNVSTSNNYSVNFELATKNDQKK